MGKGKGKAGRKETKLDAKKLNQEPKIPGMPKPPRPEKKAKKVLSKEAKSAIQSNLLGSTTLSLPIGHPKPLVKSPVHAKWPALFKKHLGVLESHIKALDRVMQNVKSEMADLPEKERLDFELGEKGNWRIICGMMDRAREAFTTARSAAQGIIHAKHLQDKKGLGVVGTSFERLEPELDKKAADIGYNPAGKGKLGRNPEDVDEDGDSEMTDTSDASDDSDAEEIDHDVVADNTDFIQLSIGSKMSRFPSNGAKPATAEENATAVEPNPYFVVDIEPTPVNLQPAEPKKSRKQLKEEAALARKAAREAKKSAYEASKLAGPKKPTPQPEPEVDFAALEASLQAEIAAATKIQEEDAARELSRKSKKKRRRSSGVDEEVVEKEKEKKGKGEEDTDADGGAVEEAKKVKKEKRSKEKKRKADDGADGEEPEEGTKKKRKHKGDA
ncbi:hypothetical protein ONS96_013270 [Cadophora gregata f. sp. sojae]|nr:hypothetical protein ONS96_013270 [Cadophora gregata f. sp. sojae]